MASLRAVLKLSSFLSDRLLLGVYEHLWAHEQQDPGLELLVQTDQNTDAWFWRRWWEKRISHPEERKKCYSQFCYWHLVLWADAREPILCGAPSTGCGADKLFYARQGPKPHSPQQHRALRGAQSRAVLCGLDSQHPHCVSSSCLSTTTWPVCPWQ